MRKVYKIALISFLFLVIVFALSLKQNYPISISVETGVFFQIPIYFWLFLILSPFLLFIIAKSTQNNIVVIGCAMLYFFIFYSVGLYFVSLPFIGDVDVSILQELVAFITHIGPQEIAIESYLQFPVFFLFSKIFSSILGIAPIITNNLGFIVLITIFPLLISLFYEKRQHLGNLEKYFIIPTLYLVLSYYFLNDQFVPQFLGLVYLMITFGCYHIYNQTEDKKFFIFFIIFYILTVFSHGFLFIFFLIAVLFEKIWLEYVEKDYSNKISYEMIILIIMIPMIFISIYLNELISASISYGSQRIFDYIFSGTSLSEVGFNTQPLYYLIPTLYDDIFSNLSRLFVGGTFVIVTICFLLNFFERKRLVDLGIIFASFSWFIMGFFNLVLGERAVQVTPVALSGYFKYSHKFFSLLTKIIIVVILVFPFFAIGNTLINESIGGQKFIQDYNENIAGRFLDNHMITNSTVYVSQNPYPVGDTTFMNYTLKRYLRTPTFTLDNLKFVDYILISPKFTLTHMYLNVPVPRIPQDCVIYHASDIEIVTPYS